MFIKNLGKSEGNITCIANNEEKYICFSKDVLVGKYINNKTKEEREIKHEIRLIDSFKFMASSFESLVGNLVISGSDKLRETQKVFGVQKDLVSRKGVYPYDYIGNISKFNESLLPPKSKFFQSSIIRHL